MPDAGKCDAEFAGRTRPFGCAATPIGSQTGGCMARRNTTMQEGSKISLKSANHKGFGDISHVQEHVRDHAAHACEA